MVLLARDLLSIGVLIHAQDNHVSRIEIYLPVAHNLADLAGEGILKFIVR